jgi:hypothetical protein
MGELILYVNTELQKIANWFRGNKIAVNATKTSILCLERVESTLIPLIVILSLTIMKLVCKMTQI